MPRTAAGEYRMIRNRSRAWILALAGLVFVAAIAVVVPLILDDGEPLVAAVVAVVLGAFALWCVLTALSGVLVSDQGVIIRRYAKDRALTWDEIETFGLEPVSTKLDGDVSKPAVRLRTGEVIRLIGVEPPGRPLGFSSKPIVFAQLEELDRLARARRT